jgi:hypothetical protein
MAILLLGGDKREGSMWNAWQEVCDVACARLGAVQHRRHPAGTRE